MSADIFYRQVKNVEAFVIAITDAMVMTHQTSRGTRAVSLQFSAGCLTSTTQLSIASSRELGAALIAAADAAEQSQTTAEMQP